MIRRSSPKLLDASAATAVDLFCGAGGLTRGLLNAGISVAAGYDIDAACKYPFEHNNKPAVFKQTSVTEISGKDLGLHYPTGHVRILVGCAPCQTFSKYTRGLDNESDEKWTLLSEFARLIRELKPDIVSMENVPQLQHYAIFDKFLALLRKEKFHFAENPKDQIVYCPDYGMAQHRHRLVVVASRFGPIKLIAPTRTRDSYETVQAALSKLPPLAAGDVCESDPLHCSAHLTKINLQRIKASRPGGTWRDWPKELVAKCHKRKSGKTYPSVYGRMDWKKPSPTITTQFYGFGNGRFGHPEQHRAISLREGAILQSFPSDYEFIQPGRDYSFKTVGRMIGNAVPVRLGEVVGSSIVEHLKQYVE